MSSGQKACAEDEEHYLWLCKHYGEKYQLASGHWMIDCYGKHATELKERHRREGYPQ